MWNCVDDKKDNEEGRAPLEYLPRGPRVSSYAAGQYKNIRAQSDELTYTRETNDAIPWQVWDEH